MAPRPRTSSAGVTSGRGRAKQSCARPSGVIRTRCGWSQPEHQAVPVRLLRRRGQRCDRAGRGQRADQPVGHQLGQAAAGYPLGDGGAEHVVRACREPRGRARRAAGRSPGARSCRSAGRARPSRRRGRRRWGPSSPPIAPSSGASRRNTVTRDVTLQHGVLGPPELGAGRGVGPDAGAQPVAPGEQGTRPRWPTGWSGRCGSAVRRSGGGSDRLVHVRGRIGAAAVGAHCRVTGRSRYLPGGCRAGGALAKSLTPLVLPAPATRSDSICHPPPRAYVSGHPGAGSPPVDEPFESGHEWVDFAHPEQPHPSTESGADDHARPPPARPGPGRRGERRRAGRRPAARAAVGEQPGGQRREQRPGRS